MRHYLNSAIFAVALIAFSTASYYTNHIHSDRQIAAVDDQAILSGVAQLEARVYDTVKNSFEKPITKYKSPDEIVNAIIEINKILETIGEKEYARLQADNIVQSAYRGLIKILITGRGQNGPSEPGWFYANTRSENGQKALGKIGTLIALTDESKDAILQFVKDFDATNAGTRINAGFPPKADFYALGDDHKNDIAMVVGSFKSIEKPTKVSSSKVEKAANTAKDGATRAKQQTIDDIVANMDSKFDSSKKAIKEFLATIENNLTEESVKTWNNGEEFTDFFGRKEEAREVLEALTRIDKSHVIITGKAGVGKTTILKILSDRFVKGEIKFDDSGKVPLILELPITSVTNPSDPSAIKGAINAAKTLAEASGRHVILYVDEAHVATEMTRNALKSFLTEDASKAKVHFIFSTTAQEGRKFLQDVAFKRRFVDVFCSEFSVTQTIDLIKKTFLRKWKKIHGKEGIGFENITDEAYDFAAKFSKMEQPDAGNPTGMKEMLEGAIVHKQRMLEEKGELHNFTLGIEDIRAYMQSRMKLELVPGDENFATAFEDIWNKFNSKYVGNDGFKKEMKEELYHFFANRGQLKKMKAFVFFGPPGGGKSYGAEELAATFFKNSLLSINGAEYKEGGLSLNKLIGSPTGTVGSEDQRSILSKFFADNPHGGVIKIEEADYLHQDVIQLLTNMITEKKFVDGLGKEWDTANYILIANSNIGQEMMIPPDATKNKMTWAQYEIRKAIMTDKTFIGEREVEVVKPSIIKKIFENFMNEIVTKSNPSGDTSSVAQEASKQMRRWKAFFIMPPTREELRLSGVMRWERFRASAKLDYNVDFKMSDEDLERVLNIENFEFEKGHSFVEEQLEDKIFKHLPAFYARKGESFEIAYHIDEDEGRKLLVKSSKGTEDVIKLGKIAYNTENQWAQSPDMLKKIRNFAGEMTKHIKGMKQQIEETKNLLKLKSLDWNTRVVITQLGTSGNGKTEYFKGMARTLYGDEQAMFKITGLNHKFDLANYFRPPTGVQGGKEETQFEKWFKARKNAGGGIILFDELLSLDGLDGNALTTKIELINELYELLDEGKVRFGNKLDDARGFIIGITGNGLQKLFDGLDGLPSEEADKLIARVLENTDQKAILEYFSSKGVDAPKVARFGKIFVNGPLSKETSFQVGKKEVLKSLQEIIATTHRKITISIDDKVTREIVDIDDEITHNIVKKLSTIQLGMRDVNAGIKDLITASVAGIMNDLPNVKKIQAKLDGDKIKWYADGKEVALEARAIDGSMVEESDWNFVSQFEKSSRNTTPQFSDLRLTKVTQLSEREAYETAVHEVKGHWMAAVLLTQKNPSEAINLIPAKNYLGYVRPKEAKLHESMGMADITRRMIMLEAGARSLFLENKFLTGGGDGGTRDPKAPPSDDMGKIEKMLDVLLSNQQLDQVSEFSSPQEKGAFKKVMRMVNKEMTTYVLQVGNKSKLFDDAITQVVKERYLGETYLDNYVEHLDWGKLSQSGDGLLGAAFGHAVERVQSGALGKLSPFENKLLNEFGKRLHDEIEARPTVAFMKFKESVDGPPAKMKKMAKESCMTLASKLIP